MSDTRRLLIVDDEAVICHACRRVFSRQGFEVKECTDAREGLKLATENDYDGILLDIKMPGMDGIQFLEQLRTTKPDQPVLIMTGYPSVPNAAAAVRLGASDYITKPFSPEEISQSVQRMLAKGAAVAAAADVPDAPSSEFVQPIDAEENGGELLFLDHSWLRLEADGSACVGTVLPLPRHTRIDSIQLPRIGEIIYRGLPVAGVKLNDETQVVVSSPVSGIVVGVNELLKKRPSAILESPCGAGWMCCLCTTRLDDEVVRCQRRRVILVNAAPSCAEQQRQQLESLGCRTTVTGDGGELIRLAQSGESDVVVFDADSFGDVGPTLVGRVNMAAPLTKIVVVASTLSERECLYRQQKIFYYGLEPFADNEIVEILDAAFRRTSPPICQKCSSEPIGGLRITNRNGHKVQLLASPAMSSSPGGLGWRIKSKLTERGFPITTVLNNADVSPTNIVKMARLCDRVMVLTAKDTERLPGTLLRDTKAEFGSICGETNSRVTTLEVQPAPNGIGFEGLRDQTTKALAEHIVWEMTVY